MGRVLGVRIETSGVPGIVYAYVGGDTFIIMLSGSNWVVYSGNGAVKLGVLPDIAAALGFCRQVAMPVRRGRHVAA